MHKIGDLRVAVVTVTYGSRWNYLKQVLSTVCLPNSIVKSVVIIDNASDVDVQRLVEINFPGQPIQVIRLDHNTGSAYGFSSGISAAAELPIDHIWLLDDDNVPDEDALSCLWMAYALLGHKESTVLSSLRIDRSEYRQISYKTGVMQKWPNSFMGFSIKKFASKLLEKREAVNSDASGPVAFPLVPIDRAPYGGLFFSKAWVGKIGLPNSDFVLYFDDHDYTQRMIENSGQLFLCANAVVRDAEISWDRDRRRGHFLFAAETSAKKIFYSVRNKVYLDACGRRRVSAMFVLNALLYVFSSCLYTIYKERRFEMIVPRLKLILSAIGDGLKGRLGVKTLS